MRLPVPNPQEVEAFRLLYAQRFGVRLNPQDAQEVATRTLQLFYLKHYPCKPDMIRKGGLIPNPAPCDTSSTPESPQRARTGRSRA